MQLAPDRGRSPKDLADIEGDVHVCILLAARLLPQDCCHWSDEALHVWVQQLSLLLAGLHGHATLLQLVFGHPPAEETGEACCLQQLTAPFADVRLAPTRMI